MNKIITKTSQHGNGKTKCIRRYLNGELCSKSEWYFDDGKLSYEFNYLNGENCGVSTSYTRDGSLIYKRFNMI